MSGRDEPTVRVRISHRSQQQYPPAGQRDPAVAFWQEVLNEPALDVRGLERRFELRFGPALKRHLPVSSFIPTTYNFDKLPVEVLVQSRRRQVAAEELIIEARVVGYGSMEVELIFGTVGKLVSAFDANVELFEMFLATYLPIAFSEAVPLAARNSAVLEGLQADFDFTTDIPLSLRQQFSALPVPPLRKSGDPAVFDRAKWAWAISNTTLVVPVLLALGVLYVAFSHLSSLTTAPTQLYQDLLSQQQAALSAERERAEMLNRIIIERLLSDSIPTDTGP